MVALAATYRSLQPVVSFETRDAVRSGFDSRLETVPTNFEIIIIGAGLSGIAFARFYLETHPRCNVLLVEQDASVGGVWSQERVFDDFWTQSTIRMSSFSDIPLQLPSGAPCEADTFPARYVTSYLENYVDSHVYNGQSLRQRVRFQSPVLSAEKKGSSWFLRIGGVKPCNLTCKRLAIASGCSSMPVIPAILLQPDCGLRVMHHRDFGKNAKRILAEDSGISDIAILGAGKSAADLVYGAAKAGKRVSWIIRKSEGSGPGLFPGATAGGRFRNITEVAATRSATSLHPSPFHPMGWFSSLHHGSETGRKLFWQRMAGFDGLCRVDAKYTTREGALPSFSDLAPRSSLFWRNGPFGVIQKQDFWEVISQKVNIVSGDIVSTSEHGIALSGNQMIPADLVLCGTGWKNTYPFLNEQLARELGLPHDPAEDMEDITKLWKDLESEADSRIMSTFPIFNDYKDTKRRGGADLTPARLYRGIVPLTDDSVVFLGRATLDNTFRRAEAQAIWATAYWDGHVALPTLEGRMQDIAYHAAFCRRRYPTRGSDGLSFWADLIWYTDKLISEAGLASHRKEWYTNWDHPCVAADLRDCRDEYIEKYTPRPKVDESRQDLKA